MDSVKKTSPSVSDAEKYASTSMNAGIYRADSAQAGTVKILFIGNSITLHGPLASIGWLNNWGMAASSPEKDYAHLVIKGLEQKLQCKVEARIRNYAGFERNFRTWQPDDNFRDDVAFKPDYLVFALGENVPSLDSEEDQLAYRQAFDSFVAAFLQDRQTPPRVVVRGVFWPNSAKDTMMEHVARKYSLSFVKADLAPEDGMTAKGLFEHPGIQGHPGDKGMMAIASRILAALANTVPAFLFGQNLEHTRGCLWGGLSAQLLRNRKFAGKPSRGGLAMDWEGFGGPRVFYELTERNFPVFTRHARANGMFRQNELETQYIQNLEPDTYGGICQGGLELRANTTYIIRAAVRSPQGDAARFRMEILSPCLKRDFDFMSTSTDWQVFESSFTTGEETTVEFRLGVEGMHALSVGMVSMLPADHFHGMRRDVIAHLKSIGTSLIRWPGGNFAGEYRWRDGLLERDERAPLQAVMEIETQCFTHGYDFNELNTDDIVALCREIGAEPYFTINPVWDSPEECAAWIEYCNGDISTPGGKLRAERGNPEPYNVKYWSLGNEMGYQHMEGEKTPAGYEKLARRLAEYLLEKAPRITLVSSGLNPIPEWVSGASLPLHDVAPVSSLHWYGSIPPMDMTTPEHTVQTVENIVALSDKCLKHAQDFQRQLTADHRISYDEWNIWYAWYRNPGVAGGIFAIRTLDIILKHWDKLQLWGFCYFQPVNEGAIEVSSRSSRLTAIGQAMQIYARHKGCRMVAPDVLPPTCMMTYTSGNALYLTCYNPSATKNLTVNLPAFNAQQADIELYTPETLLPQSRFNVQKLSQQSADGFKFDLPPVSMIAVTLR